MDRMTKVSYQRLTWFRFICCSRLSLAFLQMSSDVPDEFYQGPEVAYNLVFGHNEFTWEWQYQLRSFMHPLFYAFGYKLLKSYELDFSILLVILPRLQHAVLSIIAETMFCVKINEVFGMAVASWTAFCLSTCIFANHCLTRTLSNSLETSFMMLAFSYFPVWNESLLRTHNRRINFFKFLVFSALACFARPTSAVLSVPMSLYCLYNLDFKMSIIFQMGFVGFSALFTQITIDSLLYGGKTTFPLWNFVKFNFLSDKNKIFGTNHPLWYLYAGVPGVLGTFLPFFLLGVYKSWTDKRMSKLMLFLIAWAVFVYSIPPHKEMRFILPVLPLMLVYAAYYFANCASTRTQNLCRWSLASINAIVTLYLSITHQSGSIFAAHYLNIRLKSIESPSVAILTPCYTLPGRTHMHISNLTIRSLDCRPNLSNKPNYYTETQLFLEDPHNWVLENFGNERTFANFSYVVMFDYVHSHLKDVLSRDDMYLDKTFHYSHFADRNDGQSKNILVFANKNLTSKFEL
ncbi:GPI alpha-1,2-mannosyltransferase 3-like [Convolutriloba macropyga]|uniref:GPI alpha-1,2-mannosyltransferase 3-like n=1 Tax=Convolutriloba macropyga TaxID=536237 RepID=UPI003F51FFA2